MNKIKQVFGNKKNIIVMVTAVLALIFVLLFTPIFNIHDIQVAGVSNVDANSVIKISGIEQGQNIFKTDFSYAKKEISKVAYVDNVKITMKLPDTIVITVTEGSPCAYINFIGNYVAINEKGKILDIKEHSEEITKPIIYGVSIDSFEIGSDIVVNDENRKRLLFEMLGQIKSSGIEDQIRYMDINDTENITLTLKNKISVKFGNTDSIRYKIAYLKSILDTLTDESGGVIDLRDTENVVYDAS